MCKSLLLLEIIDGVGVLDGVEDGAGDDDDDGSP